MAYVSNFMTISVSKLLVCTLLRPLLLERSPCSSFLVGVSLKLSDFLNLRMLKSDGDKPSSFNVWCFSGNFSAASLLSVLISSTASSWFKFWTAVRCRLKTGVFEITSLISFLEFKDFWLFPLREKSEHDPTDPRY